MSRTLDPSRYYRFVQRQLRRAWKKWRQARHFDGRSDKRAIFIVGAQRSGTNMLVSVLDRSLDIWLFNEFHRAAFQNYRLRSDATIARLIDRATAPVVAFKPLCDSHLTDQFLERFAGSKAIWIYRGYQDTANSAVRNWQGHRKDWVEWIARDDYQRLGWRGERLSDELVSLMKKHYRDEMSREEAAALTWYQRTQLYYQLQLDEDPRVLLVRYESLVTSPAEQFRKIFDFLGCPFDERYIHHVRNSSIDRNSFPAIAPEVKSLCTDFLARIDDDYNRRKAAID